MFTVCKQWAVLVNIYLTLADGGTVVFWHHRLGHNPGVNYGRNIRQAVLFDFIKKNVDDGPPPADMVSKAHAAIRRCVF